jgi:hypothetical protein
MTKLTKPHTLSDGTTIRIRTRRTLVGTVYEEVPSRKRKAVTFIRLGSRMCMVFGSDLLPIENPDYAYASSDASGAEKALRFCLDSAEATIKHAAEEGIPVEDCYGPSA